MVPIRGVNDDEIKDFARLTLRYPYQIRFIEFMPFGSPELWSPEKFISSDEIKSVAEEIAPLNAAKHREIRPCKIFQI